MIRGRSRTAPVRCGGNKNANQVSRGPINLADSQSPFYSSMNSNAPRYRRVRGFHASFHARCTYVDISEYTIARESFASIHLNILEAANIFFFTLHVIFFCQFPSLVPNLGRDFCAACNGYVINT